MSEAKKRAHNTYQTFMNLLQVMCYINRHTVEDVTINRLLHKVSDHIQGQFIILENNKRKEENV